MGSRLPLLLPSLAPGLLFACSVLELPHTPKPRVEHWQVSRDLEYLEVIPEGPGQAARLPMVVFIHGMGDRPRAAWIEPDAPIARYIMPRAPEPYGTGFSWFPYRIGTGNPGLPAAIERATTRLGIALERLLEEKPTRGRIVLSGFSQGGILSFGVALHRPELVELAHPVAGWLPASFWPAAPKRNVRPVPIHAAHGTADTIIPVAPTRQMVKTLAARGFDIQLREFEGIGHSQSEPMKAMMERLIDEGIERAQR